VSRTHHPSLSDIHIATHPAHVSCVPAYILVSPGDSGGSTGVATTTTSLAGAVDGARAAIGIGEVPPTPEDGLTRSPGRFSILLVVIPDRRGPILWDRVVGARAGSGVRCVLRS